MITYDPPELLRLSRIIIAFQGQFTSNLYSPCNLTYSQLLRIRMWTMILQGAMIFFTKHFSVGIMSISPVTCMTPHETWNTMRNQPSHVPEHHSYQQSLAPHRSTPPMFFYKLHRRKWPFPSHQTMFYPGLNSSKNKTNDFLLILLQLREN